MKISILPAAAGLLLPWLCFSLMDLSGLASTVASTASKTESPSSTPTITPTATVTQTPTPTEPPHFASGFDTEMVLEESDRMERSASADWWLNSGGWFVQRDGIGSTWIGDAPAGSRWREIYIRTNPNDTDQGTHPQNLFRLITRSPWETPEERVYFCILGDNPSASVHRDKSNGVLLFLRYQDADNLFYAGVRVDGSAVIKKKSSGVYTTLAEAPWFPGAYNRASAPNLIPHQTWIGLRAVMTARGDALIIQLYIDPDRSGFWILALQAETLVDPADKLAQPGFGGIRTDFMDVEFDDYRIEEEKIF
jgi:hypothetical protein